MSNMVKILLIDDEERATDALRRLIDKLVPEIGVVYTCNDARKAAEMIHTIQPDLVFLDIRMPHVNGFELLQKLPNKNFKIIFTTAFDEYAIRAIRFSAFDYLLKPVDAEELVAAVNRFLQLKEDSAPQDEQFRNVGVNMGLQTKEQFRLALPTKEGIHFLFPHEIIRCEALGNYTKFFTTGNKQYTISKTLAEYDELLSPYQFIRTHKSHLVNINHISFVDHDGFMILKDATKIEISRRRKEDVMAALKKA
jgi:two-component system, LytTR family, response regulator